MERISVGVDKRRVIVETEIRTEQKAFERFYVDIGVAEQTPYLKSVVLVECQFTHGVLTVAHVSDRSGICYSVCLEYRNDRGHFQGILQWFAVDLVGIGEGEVLPYRNDFAYIVGCVYSSRDSRNRYISIYRCFLIAEEKNEDPFSPEVETAAS